MDEQIELLILASDGLWDVVQNDVSCLSRAFYLCIFDASFILIWQEWVIRLVGP